LLFDNGDLLQGSPLGDQVAVVDKLKPGAVHPAYKVLGMLGYDAANIGNHDFNFGLDFLRQNVASAPLPVLNSNVRLAGANGANVFKPSVLLTRRFKAEDGSEQTLKIGVVGLAPPQIMQWDARNLKGRVSADDMVQTARRLVPQLRAAGADIVVVIAHTGIERDTAEQAQPMAEQAGGALARVPGIDVLLLGHSHAEFPGRGYAQHPGADIAAGKLYGVPTTMPGRWGDHLGVIDLRLQGSAGAWKVVESSVSLRPIFDAKTRKPLVDADPAVAVLVSAEHSATLAYLQGQFATTEAPLFSYFAQVSDDPSVQIVNDAQLAWLRAHVKGTPDEKLPLLSAAAPLKTGGRNGTGAYTDIPAGPLNFRHMADLYIYPNVLQVVKLSGAELREWLEMAAGQFRRIDPAGAPEQELLNAGFPAFNFDTLDGGLSYEFDLTQAQRYDSRGQFIAPEAHRVVELKYQGKPIDPKAQFLVATSNYRANGGGNFPGLGSDKVVIDSGEETRQLLTHYLREQTKVRPVADGNWRIRPVPGVKLRFVSGAAGVQYLGLVPQVKLVKELEGGAALYELAP
ncbi:MAG TPA: bifunctional 2',3'-cyclic-nucleotide 2'-phosphodiesterase/3'-nucleotidase, partial [Burkholderiaceae bacterium]